MSRIELDERGKALENEFFRKEEERALASLREKKAREESLEALRAISGISDDVVLGHLIDVGVSAESLVAFSLVPLVSVAWANGNVEREERAAVVRAAAAAGIAEGSAAHQMLERMLAHAPSSTLFHVWEEYSHALQQALEPAQREAVARDVIGRARGVAEAAGGFLGIGKVSLAESDVLDRVEAVFAG